MSQTEAIEKAKYLKEYALELQQNIKSEIIEKTSTLEDPHLQLNCVTDIVVAQLAEINVRLHVIEQVVLGESTYVARNFSSQVSPTLSLKLADNVSVDATQIPDNENVYGLEQTDTGLPYRWTGPETKNMFSFPVARNSIKKAQIRLIGVIQKEVLSGMEVQVDNTPVPYELIFEDGFDSIVVNLPERDEEGDTQLGIEIPRTYSPSELGASDDERKLGLAICAIQVA